MKSPQDPRFLKRVQAVLILEGECDPDDQLIADGDWGPQSQAALRRFQQQAGLPETGELDFPTAQALEEAQTWLFEDVGELNAMFPKESEPPPG